MYNIFKKFLKKIWGISFRSDSPRNTTPSVITLFTNALYFSYFTFDALKAGPNEGRWPLSFTINSCLARPLEFFLQAVCVDNEENIAPVIDQWPDESKTKKKGLREKKSGSQNLVLQNLSHGKSSLKY